MTPQWQAAEFLCSMLKDISNGSVSIDRDEPGSDVFEVRSQGFHVAFVRIGVRGELLSAFE